MKYKVGDRVKVKSLDWYNKNKNELGEVDCGIHVFSRMMFIFCGKVVTIKKADSGIYDIMEDNGYFFWTDDMFEGLADARETPVEHPCDWLKRGLNLPDGYEFQDENGNVINTKKITLVKKKPKYPTTYEECKKLMNITWKWHQEMLLEGSDNRELYEKKLDFKLARLKQFLICRDAYWKIAGDWKPDYTSLEFKYYINTYRGKIDEKDYTTHRNHILTFPTAEMRDAFYENFKDLINDCKELL